jgi:nucleoside-diphosphate-sugar epimerase
MGVQIFLAGATGAIGRRLIPLLCDAGHHVVGASRSSEKIALLRGLGAEPVIVDVFDTTALTAIVGAARPEVVVHQLTDLPQGLDPARMNEAIANNARIRDEGTRKLVDAALAAGARQLVAQSIAWAYAPGVEPHREEDPLDTEAQGMRSVSVRGVIALEHAVLHTQRITGAVLRYGQLYGPGTGVDAPTGSMPLHVDAAAHAVLLAIEKRASGLFNIAEPNGHVLVDKARTHLGWRADFRASDTA